MSITPAATAPSFVSATSPSSADELLGRLVAYRPVEVRSFETKVGISEATVCQVVEVRPDGSFVDLGERPIFWIVVRRQLATATPETPWVVGRLNQAGQAYRLDGIGDDDVPAVQAAITALSQ
jgi:hypothetical protein